MSTTGFRFCVYGAQYGSEGKGCMAEWLIAAYRTKEKLVVFGENAPNSGHTNSKGKTRSLPVSAYFATHCVIGPDAAIDPWMLMGEIAQIKLTNPGLQVFVHEHAALISEMDAKMEKGQRLDEMIGSTVSGGGKARTDKAYLRDRALVMKGWPQGPNGAFEVVDRVRYFELLEGLCDGDWLFECSQGLMLDVNLGSYPFVTSRTTHPRAAIERNGLGPSGEWSFVGVYRTYPIRTGGNSGPTGGKELTWDQVGVRQEIATVTKRIRRVFEFSGSDFIYSLNLVRPVAIAFTHLDYLPAAYQEWPGFQHWLAGAIFGGVNLLDYPPVRKLQFITSDAPSKFTYHGSPQMNGVQEPEGEALGLPRRKAL